jgi:glycosyltransferase involved in cell wall biosynthesis
MTRICIYPPIQGSGGPAAFQARLKTALADEGVEVTHDPTTRSDALLLSGGTRRLDLIWNAKRRGLPVVQRLAQLNWVQRVRPASWRHSLRAERNNLVLAFIRRFLATRVVYQSHFVEKMWADFYGKVTAPGYVIYNATQLDLYRPLQGEVPPAGRLRLLVVEGDLGDTNAVYLENAARLAQALQARVDQPVELVIAGKVPQNLQQRWTDEVGSLVTWAGVVPRADIPALDRSAHLLFSAELNAGCPNSVIEALACGLPVVGYATGALPELVKDGAGELADYGGDAWKLEPPDCGKLAEASLRVLANQEEYRAAARRRAETLFDAKKMARAYLDVLLG